MPLYQKLLYLSGNASKDETVKKLKISKIDLNKVMINIFMPNFKDEILDSNDFSASKIYNTSVKDSNNITNADIMSRKERYHAIKNFKIKTQGITNLMKHSEMPKHLACQSRDELEHELLLLLMIQRKILKRQKQKRDSDSFKLELAEINKKIHDIVKVSQLLDKYDVRQKYTEDYMQNLEEGEVKVSINDSILEFATGSSVLSMRKPEPEQDITLSANLSNKLQDVLADIELQARNSYLPKRQTKSLIKKARNALLEDDYDTILDIFSKDSKMKKTKIFKSKIENNQGIISEVITSLQNNQKEETQQSQRKNTYVR